ncbi:hypothetical protein [Bartonella jaculi]|uniref:Uncharacterized protein n=1 Tax=Bartonella jaculi TaxID=686226 RepID=A0ABP9NCM5_9HYPH
MKSLLYSSFTCSYPYGACYYSAWLFRQGAGVVPYNSYIKVFETVWQTKMYGCMARGLTVLRHMMKSVT